MMEVLADRPIGVKETRMEKNVAKSKQQVNDAFAKLLKSTRESRRVTQDALARAAGVSSRTVFKAEKPELVPRADIVARLALALDQDPKSWLKTANRVLSEGSLAELKTQSEKRRESAPPTFPGQLEPQAFASALKEDLRDGTPALLCVAYMSKPTAKSRSTILDSFARLIGEGLWLAMFCPYPKVAAGSEVASDLNRHYRDICLDVASLARDYWQHPLVSGHLDRIRVFVPISTNVVVPPSTALRIRPTLVKRTEKKSPSENSTHGLFNPDLYRVGMMIDIPPYDQSPKWIDMFNPQSQWFQASLDLLNVWRDYFMPALKPWHAENGKWSKTTFGDAWKDEYGGSWAVADSVPELESLLR